MKLKSYLFCIAFFASAMSSQAQSGWSTSRYYAEAGPESLTCGACFYNAYGEIIQNCQKRNWYQVETCTNVYSWNSKTQSWNFEYKCGYWWTYNWANFQRYCY